MTSSDSNLLLKWNTHEQTLPISLEEYSPGSDLLLETTNTLRYIYQISNTISFKLQ